MTHRIRNSTLELAGGKVTGMMYDNIAARDAIPASARHVGMIARTLDGKVYRLSSGLANTDWVYIENDGYEFQVNNSFSTYVADVELHVETTGDDSNDGRTIGTAFLTLQRAFDELPQFFAAEVTIIMGAGSFAGGTLRSSGNLTIEGSWTSVATLSSISDDGFIAGKGCQKAFSEAGSSSLVEGTHFVMIDDYPEYPIFKNSYILRTSASPGNHILVNRLPLSSTPVYAATWDTTITSQIEKRNGVGHIPVKYCHLNSDAGAWFTGGVEITGCKLSGANIFYMYNGSNIQYSISYSEVFFRSTSSNNNSLASNLFNNKFHIESSYSSLNRVSGVFNTTEEPKFSIGGEAQIEIRELGPCDFEGAGKCIELYSNSKVIQNAQKLTCSGTGSLAHIGENCSWQAQNATASGTVTAPMILNDGSHISGMTYFSLVNTSVAGEDIKVGTGSAASAWADLPLVNITSLARAGR